MNNKNAFCTLFFCGKKIWAGTVRERRTLGRNEYFFKLIEKLSGLQGTDLMVMVNDLALYNVGDFQWKVEERKEFKKHVFSHGAR